MILPVWWEEPDIPVVSGSFVVPFIPSSWLGYAWQIHHKNGNIHTIRCASPDRVITTPNRLHLDVKGAEVIEASVELHHILRDAFPWLSPKLGRMGGYSSHFAGAIAKKVRPSFGRLPELLAKKGMIGSRSQVFEKSGEGSLVEYDIPSAFPTAALGRLPAGTPYFVPVDSSPSAHHIDMVEVSGILESEYGVLPIREDGDISYPGYGYYLKQWYFAEEVNAALELCDTVDKFVIHRRLRFRAHTVARGIMSRLIALRHNHPEHQKSIKMISNMIIGMFAFTGARSVIFTPKSSDDIRRGDWLLDMEANLWGRKVSVEKKPHTYRPFVASYIWSKARIALLEAIYSTERPVSCHVDGILAHAQAVAPLGTRAKKSYDGVSFECPWRGALYINGEREKAPGVKR